MPPLSLPGSVQTAPRFFNTAGPYRAADHYMLRPPARLPGVLRPARLTSRSSCWPCATSPPRRPRSFCHSTQQRPASASSRPCAAGLCAGHRADARRLDKGRGLPPASDRARWTPPTWFYKPSHKP